MDKPTKNAEELWQHVPYHIRLALLAWSREQAQKHHVRYSEECLLQEAFNPRTSGIANMQEDHAFASRCVNDAKAAGQRHFTLSSGYLALASFLDSYSGSLVDEEDEDTPGTQQETEGE